VSHPVRFISLLLAVACPVFALAQDNKSSEPPMHTKSALLVVDAQVGVLSTIWESKRVIGNLEKLVGKARTAGVPVIWVQHSDDDDLLSDGKTVPAESIVADLNAVFEWISFPNVRTEVRKTADVAF